MFSLHVLPVSLHAPSLLSGFPPTDLDVRLLVSLYWLHACMPQGGKGGNFKCSFGSNGCSLSWMCLS